MGFENRNHIAGRWVKALDRFKHVELHHALKLAAIALNLFMGTWWGLKSTYLVPIPFPVAFAGFHFLDQPFVPELLMLVGAGLSLFCLRRKTNARWLLLCGFINLLACLSTGVHRPAFNLCPPLILIFLAISEIAKSAVPLLIFNASIFLIAGFEKFVRYQDTLNVMKVRYAGFTSAEFIASFPVAFWSVIKAMAIFAGPGEVLLGTFMLVARLRWWTVLAVMLFHWLLIFMSSGRFVFIMVGIIVSVSICLVQTFDSGKKVSDLHLGSKSGMWIVGAAFVAALVAIIDFHPVLSVAIGSSFVMAPFFWILWRARSNSAAFTTISFLRPANVLATVLASSWGLLPILLKFKTIHLGFALFTANQWDLPTYQFNVDMKSCAYQPLNPIIRVRNEGRDAVFYAIDRTALEKWRGRILEDCVAIAPSEIVERPPSENPLRLSEEF